MERELRIKVAPGLEKLSTASDSHILKTWLKDWRNAENWVEAVWDHLNNVHTKRPPTFKEEPNIKTWGVALNFAHYCVIYALRWFSWCLSQRFLPGFLWWLSIVFSLRLLPLISSPTRSVFRPSDSCAAPLLDLGLLWLNNNPGVTNLGYCLSNLNVIFKLNQQISCS